MSTRQHKSIARNKRRVVQLHTLDEQPQPRKTPASAQEVLVAWLLWLPANADPQAAAQRELERMANHTAMSDEAKELQQLLTQIASG